MEMDLAKTPSPQAIVNYEWSSSTGEESDKDIVQPGRSRWETDTDESGPEWSGLPQKVDSTEPVSNSVSEDGQQELNKSHERSSQQAGGFVDTVLPLTAIESTPDSDSTDVDSTDVAAPPSSKKRRKSGTYSLPATELPESMRELFSRVEKFFTRPVNLQRGASAITSSTFNKVRERLCCYLGFMFYDLKGEDISDEAVFQNPSLIEEYMTYLSEVRLLSPATVSNHVSAILYVVKYLHSEKSPSYHGIPLIAQLRKSATELQKQGDIERPSTTQDLKCQNKWLDWDQILQCLALQRQHCEMANGVKKARSVMDLLLISLYVQLPPSRAQEIRTLKIRRQFDPKAEPRTNVVVLARDGEAVLHMVDYKTKKFRGNDRTTLERDSELARLLRDYVEKHREGLLSPNHTQQTEDQQADDDTFLFLNSTGSPFSGPAFTKHLKSLFFKLSGVEISVNALRSAFVTYVYSQENCTDSMKTSLAHALRHSREQAQTTYDKRTAAEKKNEAVQFARDCAENMVPGGSTPTMESAEPTNNKYDPGQFVALVEDCSTAKSPKLLIGRVQRYVSPGEVELVWYRNLNSTVYALELDGSPRWIENESTLHVVKMTTTKRRPDQYTLSTSKRTIHKAAFGASKSRRD